MEIDELTGAAVVTVVSPKYGEFRLLVDVEDYARVIERNWCVTKGKYFHTSIKRNGKRSKLKLHRFIMGEPEGLEVDHRNPAETFDMRKGKLRVAAHQKNMMNREGWSRQSKYKGVYPVAESSTWRSSIAVDSVSIYLGTAPDEIGAALLYDEAAIKYHGEFAQLNFGGPSE